MYRLKSKLLYKLNLTISYLQNLHSGICVAYNDAKGSCNFLGGMELVKVVQIFSIINIKNSFFSYWFLCTIVLLNSFLNLNIFDLLYLSYITFQ